VLLHELLVLAQAGVHVEEDHALRLEVGLELVVDDLRLVLSADAREVLLLRLRDAELVPGVLDVGRELLPRLGLLLGRLDVVVDVVEVDPAEVAAPRRQRPGEEVVERGVAELPHPVGLALVRGDRVDQLVRETAPRLEEVVLGDVESVLDRVVGADPLDDLGFRLRHQAASFRSHFAYPLRSSSCASSGPPSSTMRPSTNTCTWSGSMWLRIRW